MPVVAKVSSSTAGLVSAPVQAVQGLLDAPMGSAITLNIAPDAVAGFIRQGTDLLVQLKSGETVRIANFYGDPGKLSHLFLVDEDGLLGAEVGELPPGTLTAAAYTPIDATAGFAADAQAAGGAGAGSQVGAGAGAAGAEAGATAAAGAGAGAGAGIGGISLGTLASIGAGVAASVAFAGVVSDDSSEEEEPTPAPDTTAPTAPTALAINAAGTTLTGNAEADATVRVDVDGNGTADYTATVGANGTFSVPLSPSLVDGQTVSVTVRDAAGNTSPAATVTAPDTTAPAAPSSVTISADGMTISGVGVAGHTVEIDVDQDGDVDHTTEIGASGTFSILLAEPLDNGEDLHVTFVDDAGNESAPLAVIAPDLTPPPAVAPVVAPSNGATFSGTAGEGVVVILTDGAGNTLGEATVGAGGAWSFTPAAPLPHGTVVTVSALNAGGEPGPSASVTVDSVAPAVPIFLPSNGETLAGTAEAGASIVLTDGNGDPVGEVVAEPDGTWSFTPTAPLPDGTIVTAQAVDAAGNIGPAAGITVDAFAPSAPTVNAPSGRFISGAAEAGATVVLADADGDLIVQIAVGSSGNWSFAPAAPFADGTAITVVVRDATGNTSPEVTVIVDAAAPAVPVIDATRGFVLSGTAEAGSTVTLTDGNGNPIAQLTADGNGEWSFTPASPLPNGTVVNAVATDAVGNTSAPGTTTVDTVAPAAPILDASNGMVLSGTAEAGATVTLTEGSGTPLGIAVAGSDGAWSFALTVALLNGTLVTAVATDAAGNSGPAAGTVVDTIAPPSPTVDPSNGATVSGTAEAGATVLIADGNGSPVAEVAADGTGLWAFTPASALVNGTVLTVTAQDAAGNASSPATITVDGVAPAAPMIAASNGSVVSGTAEGSALVTLTDGNGNPIGQVSAAANGSWSFAPGSPLPNGTVVNAVATDASRNTSLPGSTTVDSVAPPAPVLDPSNGTQISGTAEAGATVTLTDGLGNPIGTTTVDASGTWDITPGTPLAHDEVIRATVTDAAGNTGLEASTRVDAIAPPAPVIDPSDGTQITGTAEISATVTVTDGSGNPVGTVTADSLGNWVLNPTTPLAGGTVVNAVAQDAAGNASGAASTTVDSTAPADPTIDPTNGSVVTGTAEPNSTVVLMDGSSARAAIPNLGAPIGETQADASGNWTFTPTVPLLDGTVVIAVSVDAAGNVSGPVSTPVDGVAPLGTTIDPTTGVTLTGTAEVGTTVILTGLLGAPIGEAVPDASGNWTFTPAPPLANGTLVVAVARDDAGNQSLPASTIADAIIPSAPIIAASNGTAITGTAEPGTTILLSNNLGVPIGEVSVGSNGNWTFTPATPLPNGTFVVARAENAAGNVSQSSTIATDSVPPITPTVAIAPDGSSITGIAETGSQLRIVINGDTANPILHNMGASSLYALPLIPPLINAETISVTAVDAAGNASSSASVTAPYLAAPTVAIPEATDAFINGTEASNGIQVDVSVHPAQLGQVITVTFAGQNGYTASATHTISPADVTLGNVVVSLQPDPLGGPFPQGASTITAHVGSGASATPVPFTIDTVAPSDPVLSLLGNVLTISAQPGTDLLVTANLGGVSADVEVTVDNSGLVSLNLLTDLDVDLDWNQLLDANVQVVGTDPAGNSSNVVSLAVLPSIEQPVTIGNFAVNADLLNPFNPQFGLSGTTEPDSSVVIRVITPALNVELLPIQADSNGHFSLDLLSPTILSQLQLNITDVLNLGSEISFNLVSTDTNGNDSAAYGVTLGSGPLLSLNIGQIDVNGTSGDDVMSGANGSSEHINAGDGSDLVFNVGTGDHVLAGNGDDTMEFTATNFVSADGGAGFDTVLLANGINLDYNSVGVGTISGVERFDLGSGDTGSTLTLSAAEVNAVTSGGNTLQITGEANDVLNVTGAVDTGTTTMIEGVTYDVYTFGATIVQVEENTVQVNV